MRHLAAALVLLILLLAGCSDDAAVVAPAARRRPQARTEVAGAALNGRVAVVGGLTADGAVSARVNLYDPKRRRWLRLPDMPAPRHHAMAASRGDRLYVAGGYGDPFATGEATDTAWVLYDRRWHPLPAMPEPRAAGGAVIVRNRLYVVGGVGPGPRRPLATSSMYLDLRTLRWSLFRGLPTPREHLGVTALGGRVYAIGGRDPRAGDQHPRGGGVRHGPPGVGHAAGRAHPARRQRRHPRRRAGRGGGRRGARGHDRAGRRLRPEDPRRGDRSRRARARATGRRWWGSGGPSTRRSAGPSRG